MSLPLHKIDVVATLKLLIVRQRGDRSYTARGLMNYEADDWDKRHEGKPQGPRRPQSWKRQLVWGSRVREAFGKIYLTHTFISSLSQCI